MHIDAVVLVEQHCDDVRLVGGVQVLELEQRHQVHAKRQFVFRSVRGRDRVAETVPQVHRQFDGPVVTWTAAIRVGQQAGALGAQQLVEFTEARTHREVVPGPRPVRRGPFADAPQHRQRPLHVNRMAARNISRRWPPSGRRVHLVDEGRDVGPCFAPFPTEHVAPAANPPTDYLHLGAPKRNELRDERTAEH